MKYNLLILAGILIVILARLSLAQDEHPAIKSDTIPNSPSEICPLLVGERTPSVTLKTPEGQDIDLKTAVSQKPTLLIFYRGGWCPYCNLHLAELQQIEPDLLALGYQIIAVSVDRFEKLNPTIEEQQLHYTLLADAQATATRAFGLAYKVSDDAVQRLKGFGMDIEDASGRTHHILPVPAAFIIGTDGVIKFSYVNPDYKTRVNGDVILAAAKAEVQAD